MPHKLYKILLILGIVATFAAIPAFWLTFQAAGELEVSFLDVGQGDAILIKTPFGHNILIDGGPDNTVARRLAEELPWWDRKIDLMILSHPHSDHVAGLIDIIKRYSVKKILYTGAIHSSPDYLTWLDLIKERKVPLIIIDRPQVIKFGEQCELEIIYPQESFLGQIADNLNNSSIISKLDCQQTKFLFTGDAEFEVEKELVKKGLDLRADVLKVGHHGSPTSSSQEFLEKVLPKIAVIQAGANNDFSHPSPRIIKRLERIGARVLRNDMDSTIRLASDGRGRLVNF